MKKLFSLLFIATAAISCTDDDIRTEQNLASGPKVVGFYAPLESIAYFEDTGVVERNIPVSLIGLGNGQYSEAPIDVTFVEAPEMAQTGEILATQGVEYTYVSSSSSVSVEPGASFANITLGVNTGALNPTDKTVLYLKLTSATSGSTIGEQYKVIKVVFVGCQSQLAGNYEKTTTWNNGANYFVRTDEVVSLVGVNTFRTRYIGNWAVGTFTPAGYEFIDICGELSIPDQNLGQYSNDVLGVPFADGVTYNGLVAADGNSFETTYDVVPYPGLANRVFRTTYVRL